MATDPELLRLFPAVPTSRATWAPIYLEPNIGSGERLTIAVAARTDGGARVVRAISEQVLSCMFGDQADAVADIVDIVVESLEEHLKGDGALDDWEAPFVDTVVLGPSLIGLGSLEEVAQAGLRLTSSLAARSAAIAAISDDVSRIDAVRLMDRWESAVRAAVVASQPDWDDRFGKSYRLRTDAAPTRLGYAGPRIAAHFLRLLPSGLSRMRQQGKAKLFDLRLLRDHDGGAPRYSYELLVWRPLVVGIDYDERQVEATRAAALELEDFADHHELRVETLPTEHEAAARLIQMEAA